MPIDGNAYLVSQGWNGKGSGLRHGAISKPIIANQKKTLSGIGKDRDEAFPFWDHVFNAAASKIKVKVDLSESGEDDSDTSDEPNTRPHLHRTSTGIISHRRPITGTPALSNSGSATPSSSSGTFTPRNVSLLTAAKQEAARRTLYSMFFRGPIMRSDDVLQVVEEDETAEVEVETAQAVVVPTADPGEKGEKVKNRVRESEEERVEKKRSKKEKSKHRDAGNRCDDNAEGVSSPKKKRRKDD